MEQHDPRTDPNRTAGEHVAANRISDERTISTNTMAAIVIAAMIVLGLGLSFLAPEYKTAQTTNPPSASDRVTPPPAGTTGQAPH